MQSLHNYGSERTFAAAYKPISLQLQKDLLRKPRRLSQDLGTRRYSIASQDQISQISKLSPETINLSRRSQLIKSMVQNNIQKSFSLLTQFYESYLKRKHISNAFFILTAMNSLTNCFGLVTQKIQIFIHLGELYKNKSQFQKSIRVLRKALEYAWLIKSNYYELLLYDKIGIVMYVSGDVERAGYYHDRFAQSHLESALSPAHIVAMENVKKWRGDVEGNRSSRFSYHILSISYLVKRVEEPPEVITEEFLELNLQVVTEEKFDILSDVFLKSNQFIDKIQSIEPLQVKNRYQPEDSPTRREVTKIVQAYDRRQRIRNHNKLQNKSVKKPFQIPKCFNIHRMIEQRINDKSEPIIFEDYYHKLKIKSLSISKQEKKVNLPVLISHMGKH